LHRQLHQRQPRLHHRQQRRHHRRHHARDRGDAHAPLAPPDQPFEPRPQRLLVAQGLAHMRQQELARDRQPQPARQPLEQLDAILLLERQELAVDRRGGDPEPRRRAADRARACDRIEIAEHARMQHHRPLPEHALDAN
jgi:hypothetical protein